MPRVNDQPQAQYSPQQQQYHYVSPQARWQMQTHLQLHLQAQQQAQSPTSSQAQSIYQTQQISPLSTSSNSSSTGTSPTSQNDTRMQPAYMPAVLRPNLYPAKQGKKDDADQSSLQSNQSFLNLNAWGFLGKLTRRTTVDSGKSMYDEEEEEDDGDSVQWNLDLFPKPTSQPTREHWKADPQSTMCDEPSCMRRFNYWTRRHHCRKCGNIFCDWHSAYDVPLDQDANYNPRGTSSRACAHCFSAFKAWRSRTNSQVSSDDSATGPHSAPTSPVGSTPTAIKGAHQHPSEVAMSVPRDWNWSTF